MNRRIALWTAVALIVVAAASVSLSVGLGRGAASLDGSSLTASQQANGFYVSNGRLMDANGNDFVMRGINVPYIWFTGQTGMFQDAKQAGANTVRVVLDKEATVSQVSTAVSQCKDNQLVCILEVHDTTGWAQGNGAITLTQAADFWNGVKSAFINEQKYVLVNLGNEPQSSGTDTTWISQTNEAISELRQDGITNTLVADAPGYGQDPNYLMAYNASSIESNDPQHNVLFSVHMYSVYGSASTVSNYINYFVDNKLPLIVGEFGDYLGSSPVAWQQVLTSAQEKSIGWLAWSWSGNDSSNAELDMTNNFNPDSLTTWGNEIINGTNGLKQTSKAASIYGSGGSTGSNSFKGSQSGKCLDVTGQATADGSPVELWDCNGQGNQEWTLGSDGTLRGSQSGKCLDVSGQNTADGTSVALWDCNGQANQQWSYTSSGQLVGQQSGKCLDAYNQGTGDGTKIEIWDCNGQGNQEWSKT